MTTERPLYIVTDTDCDCGNLVVTFPPRFIIVAVMGKNLSQKIEIMEIMYVYYIDVQYILYT